MNSSESIAIRRSGVLVLPLVFCCLAAGCANRGTPQSADPVPAIEDETFARVLAVADGPEEGAELIRVPGEPTRLWVLAGLPLSAEDIVAAGDSDRDYVWLELSPGASHRLDLFMREYGDRFHACVLGEETMAHASVNRRNDSDILVISGAMDSERIRDRTLRWLEELGIRQEPDFAIPITDE